MWGCGWIWDEDNKLNALKDLLSMEASSVETSRVEVARIHLCCEYKLLSGLKLKLVQRHDCPLHCHSIVQHLCACMHPIVLCLLTNISAC